MVVILQVQLPGGEWLRIEGTADLCASCGGKPIVVQATSARSGTEV